METFNSQDKIAPDRPPSVVHIRTQWISSDVLRDMLVRDPSLAVQWTEAAAKAGLIPAQIVWAQLLLDGVHVTRNHEGAFEWFQRAAAQGNVEARNMVGRCYEQGWGVTADPIKATESFEMAASSGHAWGQVNLAQMLMRMGNKSDYPRCYALFKSAAESGSSKVNLKAMNSLARFLEEGWAGGRDLPGAAFWYMRAAKLGDHWAQYNLATILFCHGDHETADKLIRSSIANSDNGFRRRIAYLLLDQANPQLRRLGLAALETCCAGNAPEDLYAYGIALHQEANTSHDRYEASKLIKAAAAKGHVLARAHLRPVARFRRFCSRLDVHVRTVMVRLQPALSKQEPLTPKELS